MTAKSATPKARTQWSDEDIQFLHDAVAEAKVNDKSIQTAFEATAKKTNRKAGAVQAKWYSLATTAKPKKAAVKKTTTKKTTRATKPKSRKGKPITATSTRREIREHIAANKETPAFENAIFASLSDLTAKREFCETCETPFTGGHNAEQCRDNLRARLTAVQSTIAASLPTNGALSEGERAALAV